MAVQKLTVDEGGTVRMASERGQVRGSCVSPGQQVGAHCWCSLGTGMPLSAGSCSLCHRPKKRCRHSRHAWSSVGAHDARLYAHVVNSVGRELYLYVSFKGCGGATAPIVLVRN